MGVYRVLAALCILSLAICGPASNLYSGESGYLSVNGPCHLRFPEDHGTHPGFRTEWWYYTGNLRSSEGDAFGFQLTFFRRQTTPPRREYTRSSPSSRWRTDQVFAAHAALSDISGGTFLQAERMSRAVLGLAGVLQDRHSTTVFLGNWAAAPGPQTHTLKVDTGQFALDLTLRPLKAPVLHGDSGYCRKGRMPQSAGCYYSFTRLEATGTIDLRGRRRSVRGTAWMDHEFSSAPLEEDLAGWDWFSLQFSDNTELMVYLMREKDGSWSTASSGTFVDASGGTTRLESTDIEPRVLAHWNSPDSGARYPQKWSLRILPLDMEITVDSSLRSQEMRSAGTTGVTYWEGSVAARGTRAGTPVDAQGYMELTGYDKPLTGMF